MLYVIHGKACHNFVIHYTSTCEDDWPPCKSVCKMAVVCGGEGEVYI